MLRLYLLLFFLGTIQLVLPLEHLSGENGEELKIECIIEGDECIFVSARGTRICTSYGDSNCESQSGIQIKKLNNVCRIIFYPLDDSHFGKWTCQDKSWFGSIEITETFEISPPMKISVELTEYFGDVYFKRGDGLNISCHILVNSDKEYDEYLGNPLQWKVGDKMISNENPYLPVDINEWVQVLNYAPVIKDNHERLSCFVNEHIEDQIDGINLHMIDFEFKTETIYVDVHEQMSENVLIEGFFKSMPPSRKEDILWIIGDVELSPGETSIGGMHASDISVSSDSAYSMVSLSIPPEELDVEALSIQDSYLSVSMRNIPEPFRVPIVFRREIVPPPVVQPENSISTGGVIHENDAEDAIIKGQATVNKLSNSSLLGYILGGIVALAFLCCCAAYYIHKCCCASDADEHEGHYRPIKNNINILDHPQYLNESKAGQIKKVEFSSSQNSKRTNQMSGEESVCSFNKENSRWEQLNGSNYVEHHNPSYFQRNSKPQVESEDEIRESDREFSPRTKPNFYIDLKLKEGKQSDQGRIQAQQKLKTFSQDSDQEIKLSHKGDEDLPKKVHAESLSDQINSPSYLSGKNIHELQGTQSTYLDKEKARTEDQFEGESNIFYHNNDQAFNLSPKQENALNSPGLSNISTQSDTHSDHRLLTSFSQDQVQIKKPVSPLDIDFHTKDQIPGDVKYYSNSPNFGNNYSPSGDFHSKSQTLRQTSIDLNDSEQFKSISPSYIMEKSNSGLNTVRKSVTTHSDHEKSSKDNQRYIETKIYSDDSHQIQHFSPTIEKRDFGYHQLRDYSKSPVNSVPKYTKINEARSYKIDSTNAGGSLYNRSYTEADTLPRKSKAHADKAGNEDLEFQDEVARKSGYIYKQEHIKMESRARIESRESSTIYGTQSSRHSDGGTAFTFKDASDVLSLPEFDRSVDSTHSSYDNFYKDSKPPRD